MTQMLRLVGALFAVVFLMGCMSPANAQPSAAEITIIVDRHNYYRNQAQLTHKANPALPQVVWDTGLQANAQRYLDTCPSGHSSAAYRTNVKSNCSVGSFSFVGENYSWGPTMNAQWAVDLFGDEQPNYNMWDMTCKAGTQCGHWTQMTWRASVYIGCGKRQCGSDIYFLCQYGPAGNYGGENPYQPCTSGCPTGAGAVTVCKKPAPAGTITHQAPTKPHAAPAKPAPHKAPAKPAPHTPTKPAPKPAAPANKACAILGGQCGGAGWSGPKCCQSGVCRAYVATYSQCRTGTCPAGWLCSASEDQSVMTSAVDWAKRFFA